MDLAKKFIPTFLAPRDLAKKFLLLARRESCKSFDSAFILKAFYIMGRFPDSYPTSETSLLRPFLQNAVSTVFAEQYALRSLVCNNFNHEDTTLSEINKEAWNLIKQFHNFQALWVPRAANKLADLLSRTWSINCNTCMYLDRSLVDVDLILDGIEKDKRWVGELTVVGKGKKKR